MGWGTGLLLTKWQKNGFWCQKEKDDKSLLKNNALGLVRGHWFSDILYLKLYDRFHYSFFSLPFHGGFFTLYSPPRTIFILHLLAIWTLTWVLIPSGTVLRFLWVVVAKALLFRSLLYINAVKKVVVVPLMRWQQFSFRYIIFFFWGFLPSCTFRGYVLVTDASWGLALIIRSSIWPTPSQSEETLLLGQPFHSMLYS